jgi:hypothetical protein
MSANAEADAKKAEVEKAKDDLAKGWAALRIAQQSYVTTTGNDFPRLPRGKNAKINFDLRTSYNPRTPGRLEFAIVHLFGPIPTHSHHGGMHTCWIVAI